MRIRYWLPLLCLLLACGIGNADRGDNEGTFTDSSGQEHRWQINKAHTLVWDGKPYLPAGVVFRSSYLADPTEANWQLDEQSLSRLKSLGVSDVWVDPGRGLLAVPVDATQRLVSALETQGFRYGLQVRDRSSEPLVGYGPHIQPVHVPQEELVGGTILQRTVQLPGARSVEYLLISDGFDYALAIGTAPVEKGVAKLNIPLKRSRLVGQASGTIFLLVEREMADDEVASFGDLWSGTVEYQKRLTGYFQTLKLGSGFRFVLDPFDAGSGVVGSENDVFPVSATFRQDFEKFLKRRTGPNEINGRWGFTDTRVHSLEEAARLVPSWSREDPPEKIGFLVDPVDHKSYRVTARRSQIWQDLADFRVESLKQTMNEMSFALKRAGRDVPVLFSWAGYHPNFHNNPSPNGYDGLGVEARGRGVDLARDTGALALSQVEQAARHSWLVATRLSGPMAGNGTARPYTNGEELREDWNALADVGFKGFYVDSTVLDGGTDAAAGWVRPLASGIAADAALVEKRPSILFYPALLPNSGEVRRFANGTWWLPSLDYARLMYLGENIRGYEISLPFGEGHDVRRGAVIWSIVGEHKTTFSLPKGSQVQVYSASGEELKIKPKRDNLELTLTSEPVVAVGLDSTLIFPYQAAANAIAEFEDLIQQADREKYDTAGLKVMLKDAKSLLNPSTAGHVHELLRKPITVMRELVSPYVWMEGERVTRSNFLGAVFKTGTSGGSYLKLDRVRANKGLGFSAKYVVEVRRDDSYEIWLAGRVPGRDGVSPISWWFDEEIPLPLDKAKPEGGDYTDGFAWYSLGRITLTKGRHVLNIAVEDPVPGTMDRYVFGIDALVLARGKFVPKGVEKPYGPTSQGTRPVANPMPGAEPMPMLKPKPKK